MSTPRTRSPPSATPARADAVAVDVRRCGSGDLVVVQDATVDRVTNREGAVVDMTAAELVALDVLGSGEGVPALDRVLDAAAAPVNLELKERGWAADVLAAAKGPVLTCSSPPSTLRVPSKPATPTPRRSRRSVTPSSGAASRGR
jgi:hypothetical protein